MWTNVLAAVLALSAGPVGPSAAQACPTADDLLIMPGQTLVLRVRQVLPNDDLSPGERILNSRRPLAVGDHFLAEVVSGPAASRVVIGGVITHIYPPGWWQRPGHVEVQLSQLVETPEGTTLTIACRSDLDDRRLSVQCRRSLLTLLFSAEGLGIGAAVGDQLKQGDLGFIGGGAGIGLLVGLGYAALMHGREGALEPGDTFQIVVGKSAYRPLPRAPQMTVYPAKVPVQK